MSVHTAGKWEAEHRTDEPSPDPGYWVVIGDVMADRSGPVADTMNRHHCISAEEDEANAKLLAASPALLDSCNALLGLLQLIENRCDPNLLQIIRTNHRVVEAKAAVAMATGKQS